jgi:hypothetical protein
MALGCAMITVAANGQIGHRQTTVRLPSVPPQSVELARNRAAKDWNSRFCSKWTDACVLCFNPQGLSLDAVCEPVKEDDACSPSSVRCLEFDQVIAPLFCTGLHDGCGGASLGVGDRGDDFYPASNFECLGRKTRPPVDWTCGTPKAARDRCRQGISNEGETYQQCVEGSLHVLRQYRRAFERLVRDSKRNDVP